MIVLLVWKLEMFLVSKKIVCIHQQNVDMARGGRVDVRIRNKGAKPAEQDLERIAHLILLSGLFPPCNAADELKGRPQAGVAEVFVRAAKAGELRLPKSSRSVLSSQQTAVKVEKKCLSFSIS
jgi:hypothetical protein